jgi:hypothetical protein
MKRTTAIFFLSLVTITFAVAQNSSFQVLNNKFEGRENVFSFSTSGFLAQAVLWMSGEHEFKKAVSDIDYIRFITIPKTEFEAQKVTVKGFKKILHKDEYELLASVKDKGDDVTLYIQSGKRDKINRYFLLIDSANDIVGIEIKGYIDPELLSNQAKFSYKSDL